MKKENMPNPAHNLIKQLLTLFPNTHTLTLAKKAYSLHPELWTDVGLYRFCYFHGIKFMK